MKKLLGLLAICAGLVLPATVASATEMTFQFINDTERPLNVKLFSRGESHQQWPSKSRAYSVRPDPGVQQLKIDCPENETICWGAWMTVQKISGEVSSGGQRSTQISTFNAGVGERNNRPCESCCHVCKAGAQLPTVRLRSGSGDTTAAK